MSSNLFKINREVDNKKYKCLKNMKKITNNLEKSKKYIKLINNKKIPNLRNAYKYGDISKYDYILYRISINPENAIKL